MQEFENFYGQSINSSLHKIEGIGEDKIKEIEKKAMQLVQLAMLSDFDHKKIKQIIEG